MKCMRHIIMAIPFFTLDFNVYKLRSNCKGHEKHESRNPGCSRVLKANFSAFYSLSFLNCFSYLLLPFLYFWSTAPMICWLLYGCLPLCTITWELLYVKWLFCSFAFNWVADVKPMRVIILPLHSMNVFQ